MSAISVLRLLETEKSMLYLVRYLQPRRDNDSAGPDRGERSPDTSNPTEVGASMTSPRVCEHVRRSREPRYVGHVPVAGGSSSWQLHGQPLRLPMRLRSRLGEFRATPLSPVFLFIVHDPAAPRFTQQAPSPRGTQGGKVGIYIWICTPSSFSDVHND